MAELIRQLTNEHKFLQSGLEEVFQLGISSAEGQKKLQQVKAVLLQHLQREDADLYPSLEREAASNPKTKTLIDGLRGEMREVSEFALRFFEKYANGGSGFEFAREFGQLSAMLSKRVRREEAQLYPEFERVAAAHGVRA